MRVIVSEMNKTFPVPEEYDEFYITMDPKVNCAAPWFHRDAVQVEGLLEQ